LEVPSNFKFLFLVEMSHFDWPISKEKKKPMLWKHSIYIYIYIFQLAKWTHTLWRPLNREMFIVMWSWSESKTKLLRTKTPPQKGGKHTSACKRHTRNKQFMIHMLFYLKAHTFEGSLIYKFLLQCQVRVASNIKSGKWKC
jgi:hypothetical protein